MADLSKLKNQRKGRRAYSNTLIKRLEDTSTEERGDGVPPLVEELERQRGKIAELDDAILLATEDSNVDTEIATSSDYMMRLSSVINDAKKSLKEATHSVCARNVKLPDIKLFKFSGDPLEWTKFWDLFRSSIHLREDISKPAKFHYLTSQLFGEASNLLAGFDNTEAEYDEVVVGCNAAIWGLGQASKPSVIIRPYSPKESFIWHTIQQKIIPVS
jgi:hypothetical protein